jgi:predicted Zn-ribbon and HTH transcriptional regulator
VAGGLSVKRAAEADRAEKRNLITREATVVEWQDRSQRDFPVFVAFVKYQNKQGETREAQVTPYFESEIVPEGSSLQIEYDPNSITPTIYQPGEAPGYLDQRTTTARNQLLVRLILFCVIGVLTAADVRKNRREAAVLKAKEAAKPGQTSVPEFALSPLECSKCGATVPLEAESSVTCPYCNNQVSVPPEYIDWRKENECRLETEEELAELHQSLGRPPTAFQKSIVRATSGSCAGGCLAVFLGAFLGQFAFLILWVFVQSLTFLNLGRLGVSLLVVTPYLAVILASVYSLFKLRQKTVAQINLQARLVAQRPIHEGGPATCRRCGATLAVSASKVSATCHYCHSHNLVRLDPNWIEELRRQTISRDATLRQALEAYEFEAQQGRKVAVSCVAGAFVLGLLLFQALPDRSSEEKARQPEVQTPPTPTQTPSATSPTPSTTSSRGRRTRVFEESATS